MTWKSAPQGKMVPRMSGPPPSPPSIGMPRRVPQPMSPATIGAPTWMARLNTYLVASCGVMSAGTAWRQPQREQRKQYQDHQPDQVGDHERDDAAKNRRERHVLDH